MPNCWTSKNFARSSRNGSALMRGVEQHKQPTPAPFGARRGVVLVGVWPWKRPARAPTVRYIGCNHRGFTQWRARSHRSEDVIPPEAVNVSEESGGAAGERRGPFGEVGQGAFVAVLALAVLGAWTAYYTVPSDSVAVIQRFGKYLKEVPPGLHFKLPLGIDAATMPGIRSKIIVDEQTHGILPLLNLDAQKGDQP